MIPEKGSLFLCDWSKIKKEALCKQDYINRMSIRGNSDSQVCHRCKTQEEWKCACMKKRSKGPSGADVFLCGLM